MPFALILDDRPMADGANGAALVPLPGDTTSFLQDVVGGFARPVALDGRRVMWVSDSRHCTDGPNYVATVIAGMNGSIMPGDYITGPAVITGETDAGDTVPLSVQQFRRTINEFIEH